MGVKAAFNVGEFNKLTKYDKMKVSDIKHKALIEVTREGTIGVAATGIILFLYQRTHIQIYY